MELNIEYKVDIVNYDEQVKKLRTELEKKYGLLMDIKTSFNGITGAGFGVELYIPRQDTRITQYKHFVGIYPDGKAEVKVSATKRPEIFNISKELCDIVDSVFETESIKVEAKAKG